MRVLAARRRSCLRRLCFRCQCTVRPVDRGERARPLDFTVDLASGGDPIGRHALFNPPLQCGQRVESIRSRTTATMSHSGHHKQAEELLRLLQRSPVVLTGPARTNYVFVISGSPIEAKYPGRSTRDTRSTCPLGHEMVGDRDRSSRSHRPLSQARTPGPLRNRMCGSPNPGRRRQSSGRSRRRPANAVM